MLSCIQSTYKETYRVGLVLANFGNVLHDFRLPKTEIVQFLLLFQSVKTF